MEKGHHVEKRGFFGWFNRGFGRTATSYQGFVGRMLTQAPGATCWSMALILLCVGLLYARLPTSFLPAEDQGYA